LTTENDCLKNRLKLIEMENQLLRNQVSKIQQHMALYNGLGQHRRSHDASGDSANEMHTSSTGVSNSTSTSPQHQAAAIALISLNSPNSNPTSPPGKYSSLVGLASPSSFRKPSLTHLQLKANKLMMQASDANFLKCDTIS
jgi:hypothetical protein